jgi:hypothetical protein
VAEGVDAPAVAEDFRLLCGGDARPVGVRYGGSQHNHAERVVHTVVFRLGLGKRAFVDVAFALCIALAFLADRHFSLFRADLVVYGSVFGVLPAAEVEADSARQLIVGFCTRLEAGTPRSFCGGGAVAESIWSEET